MVDLRTGGKVITALEILSPPNKAAGKGREEYLRKQQQHMDGAVNLVEIDLLRSGQPTTLAMPSLLAPRPPSVYHVSVRRAHRPERLEYYGFSLRDRLPRIAIPLRPTDGDVPLDLQALLDMAYDRGRYDDIDYSLPSIPALEGDDAT